MAADQEILRAADQGGLLLLGCGKMGGAMLKGWLGAGAPGSAITAADPHIDEALSAEFTSLGVRVVAEPERGEAPPAAVILAVKPQVMKEALPKVTPLLGPKTLIFSIAAGLPIASFEAFAPGAAVVRAMPNTPAAIGKGITALTANDRITADQRNLAEALAAVVGEVVWLDNEAQMDAVTAVSGSGPAYVFHMIEALAAAGRAEGLSSDLAMRLARATVSGAGALADASSESAETLRRNVTSPGGTTAAGLEALMAEGDGLSTLMSRTVAAAAARSRELGKS